MRQVNFTKLTGANGRQLRGDDMNKFKFDGQKGFSDFSYKEFVFAFEKTALSFGLETVLIKLIKADADFLACASGEAGEVDIELFDRGEKTRLIIRGDVGAGIDVVQRMIDDEIIYFPGMPINYDSESKNFLSEFNGNLTSVSYLPVSLEFEIVMYFALQKSEVSKIKSTQLGFCLKDLDNIFRYYCTRIPNAETIIKSELKRKNFENEWQDITLEDILGEQGYSFLKRYRLWKNNGRKIIK
jgi:hypothetical protein